MLSTRTYTPSLDDYEIPRLNRPRSGALSDPPPIALPTQESLQELLCSFPGVGPEQANRESAQYKAPLSPSLEAQPSLSNQDEVGSESGYRISRHSYADDLDTAIRSIYAPVLHIPPDSLIMNANVDDENQLLMQGN